MMVWSGSKGALIAVAPREQSKGPPTWLPSRSTPSLHRSAPLVSTRSQDCRTGLQATTTTTTEWLTLVTYGMAKTCPLSFITGHCHSALSILNYSRARVDIFPRQTSRAKPAASSCPDSFRQPFSKCRAVVHHETTRLCTLQPLHLVIVLD